jgi:hypothetical protein
LKTTEQLLGVILKDHVITYLDNSASRMVLEVVKRSEFNTDKEQKIHFEGETLHEVLENCAESFYENNINTLIREHVKGKNQYGSKPNILNKAALNTGDYIYEIKDGILFIERLKRIRFTLEVLMEFVKRRVEYTEGFSYPAILFGKDVISMDQPARVYMAGEGAKNLLSRAFVVEKLQGKLQLNFFILTNAQPIPIKVFETIEPAVEWSKQFRIASL